MPFTGTVGSHNTEQNQRDISPLMVAHVHCFYTPATAVSFSLFVDVRLINMCFQ